MRHSKFVLPLPLTPRLRSTSRDNSARTPQNNFLAVPCLMLSLSLTADDKAHSQAVKTISDAAQMAHDLNEVSVPPLLIKPPANRGLTQR